MSPRAHRKNRLTGFLGLSVLLHVNLAVVVAVLVSLGPPRSPVDPPLAPLDVSLVSANEIPKELADRKVEDLKQEVQREEIKAEEKEKDLKGQVVDIPRPAEERQPDKARFLSEHDSKVAKETKGPPVPFRPGRLVANRPPPAAQPQPAPPSPAEQKEVERRAMKLAMRTEPQLPPRGGRERDPSGDEPEKIDNQPEHRESQARQEHGTPQDGLSSTGTPRRISMKDLQLSDAELARAVGTRVNDYLKDVEEGEQTLLNARRWRFATFFNRVKRQVAENWHPDVAYRRRDPGGNVYGFRDRLTVLRVSLTPQGRLKDVALDKPCGVDFLDDEALSAFKAAQPFPNPPSGLVDKESGMISFRFGFLFEISHRPGFRIFRYEE